MEHRRQCLYGIDLLGIKDRMDRFDEACDVIVSLLTKPTTSYAGKHFTLTDAYCEPKPVQLPHPPICIGGRAERSARCAPSRVAQHWNPSAARWPSTDG